MKARVAAFFFSFFLLFAARNRRRSFRSRNGSKRRATESCREERRRILHRRALPTKILALPATGRAKGRRGPDASRRVLPARTC